MWAGDMLSDIEIPFVSQRLKAYEQTLDMLKGMDIRVLVRATAESRPTAPTSSGDSPKTQPISANCGRP